ncbi:MAG: hypothetical protein U0514_01125 [Candidatus Andersenbacteria bacterium]
MACNATTADPRALRRSGSLVFLLVPLIDLLVYHGQAPIDQFVDRVHGALGLYRRRPSVGELEQDLGLQVEVAAHPPRRGSPARHLVTGRVLRSLVAALGVYVAIVTAATLPALLALAHLDARRSSARANSAACSPASAAG